MNRNGKMEKLRLEIYKNYTIYKNIFFIIIIDFIYDRVKLNKNEHKWK